jgi:hypothetical protein
VVATVSQKGKKRKEIKIKIKEGNKMGMRGAFKKLILKR